MAGLLLILFLPLAAAGQEPDRTSESNFHSWYVWVGDKRLGKSPWSLHFDTQFRRLGIGEKPDRLLLRPAVDYNLTDKLQFSVGYAFIRSQAAKGAADQFSTPEHRPWQQITFMDKFGRVKLKHRCRLEQRLLGVKVADDSGKGRLDRFDYTNRFRYLLGGKIPLRVDAQGNTKLFLAIYNEVFVQFGGQTRTVFDQNRAYGALGFRLPKIGRMEIGYMQQTFQDPSGSLLQHNHTFMLSVFSTEPLKW